MSQEQRGQVICLRLNLSTTAPQPAAVVPRPSRWSPYPTALSCDELLSPPSHDFTSQALVLGCRCANGLRPLRMPLDLDLSASQGLERLQLRTPTSPAPLPLAHGHLRPTRQKHSLKSLPTLRLPLTHRSLRSTRQKHSTKVSLSLRLYLTRP